MAQNIPTPDAGSWLELSLFSGTWTPQPDAGTWLRLDLFTGWRNKVAVGMLLVGGRGLGSGP